MNDNPTQSLQQLIHNPAKDYYIFKADTIPEQDSLTHYIRKEFSDFDVLTDVKLGAYSSTLKKYVYEDYIPTAASGFHITQAIDYRFIQDYDHILLISHRS
jgi:hypothetical protein